MNQPSPAIEILGYIAASLTTLSFIPQAMRTLSSGDTRGISLSMYALFTSGIALWLVYGIGGMPPANWMSLKLVAVVLAIGYHHLCAIHLRYFESGEASHSHIWYRWFNEAPVLLMVAAVVFVVVKPF